jgi:hypothetical protein
MSAAQQQKAAASTSAAGAEQEEVEHGPFPIEQLQVRAGLPSPSALTLASFLGPVLVPLVLEWVAFPGVEAFLRLWIGVRREWRWISSRVGSLGGALDSWPKKWEVLESFVYPLRGAKEKRFLMFRSMRE